MSQIVSKPASILIVEDEVLIALFTSATLSDLGYDVIGIAKTAEDALQTANRHRPDLVLMDITLRGQGDGIEAAQRLKEHLGVPVLFVTAHADGTTMERAAAAKPAGYLVKPFSPRQLGEAVSGALDVTIRPGGQS
ncbi:response regulator [Rhodospirillaceae bacterium SYSU D60014]|uniref:response regulator n=1 Tax=Virgifigura deserti TaxID=2268457 RepID=UPI000E66FAD2